MRFFHFNSGSEPAGKSGASGGELLFYMDSEPTLSGASTDQLSGWVTDGAGPVKLQLRAGERIIEEFSCRYPRMDVFKSFPSHACSLFSGFEIKIPLSILSMIGSERVSVVAVFGAGEKKIWEWAGAPEIADSRTGLAELKKYFDEVFSEREFSQDVLKNFDSGAEFKLTLVIKSFGQYPYLLNSLRGVLESLKSKESPGSKRIDLDSVVILTDGEADATGIRAHLNEALPQGLDVGVFKRSEFPGWDKAISRRGDATSRLILHLDERYDSSYLQVGALISDFIELGAVTLLMPTLYGSSAGISGPRGLHLAELKRRISGGGRDIPVLYPTKKLSPIWISSLAFLEAVENEFGSDKFGVRHISGINPPEDLFVYHLDLRQPYTAHSDSVLTAEALFTATEKTQMEHLINEEVRLVLGSVTGTVREGPKSSSVAFIIPPEWTDYTANRGPQFQVFALANHFRRNGCEVTIVRDSEDPVSQSIAGFSTVSFTAAAAYFRDHSLGWAISTSWSTVRSANVLRYLSRAKVANFLQQSEERFFEKQNRENFDNACWSQRGTFLPLVNSAWIKNELRNRCHGMAQSVELGIRYNAEVFRPWQVSRDKNSAVFLLDGKDVNFQETLELYRDVISELRAKIPGVLVSAVGFGEIKKKTAVLLEICDRFYHDLSPADLARLYSKHEVVVDCTTSYGFSSTLLEAAACGAVPLIGDRTAVEVYANPERSGESEGFYAGNTSREISGTIQSVLSDVNLKARLITAGKSLVGASQGDFDSDLMRQMTERYQAMVKGLTKLRAQRKNYSIIVPVYCALDATATCLRSVLHYAPANAEIIVVNDASDRGTTEALRDVVRNFPQLTLLDLRENVGFVQACIAGIEHAKPENDIVLLNSDVVLTRRSLELLQNAAYSGFDVSTASTLSTQSPHLHLELNTGDSLEQAAEKIYQSYQPKYPVVITTEGQFLYIRRWALQHFGFFDPIFNRGFCEESDMCMRMFLNGSTMICADNALIAHRKSASFGKEGGSLLKKTNRPIFDSRWSRYYAQVYPVFLDRDPLKTVRDVYRGMSPKVQAPTKPFVLDDRLKRFDYQATSLSDDSGSQGLLDQVQVVFILPSVILGGGTLSVVQHATELQLRGIETRILSLKEPEVPHYPQLAPAIPVSVDQLFNLNWTNQKVLATFWTTAYLVKALSYRYPDLDAYYYIQDYEPWFYSQPEEFLTVKDAERTYELGLKGVAKTHFLADLIRERHKMSVSVISPGVNHNVFYPGEQERYFGRPRLSGLFRPKTTRRGNREFLELIKLVKARLPETVVNLFGQTDELPGEFAALVETEGKLLPDQVGALYRESDIVVDLSYWHGFGRMGLESMACGVVPVLSRSGGVSRYAEDGRNSFIVDLDDLSDVADKIVRLVKDRELRLKMREYALHTAARFSEARAVDDWLRIWDLKGSAASIREQIEVIAEDDAASGSRPLKSPSTQSPAKSIPDSKSYTGPLADK